MKESYTARRNEKKQKQSKSYISPNLLILSAKGGKEILKDKKIKDIYFGGR